MKFNFKKIASVLATTVMLGSTVAFASAAWPAPFVANGAADAAVVYGANAPVSAGDLASATQLGEALDAKVTAGAVSTEATGGDSFKIMKTTNLFNMGDQIAGFYSTLDEEELSHVLAEGVYSNDANNEFEYNQEISLGTGNGLKLVHFQDDDFNDEKPIIGFNPTSTEHILNYTLDFIDDAEGGTNFVDLETTDLTMLGVSYYIVDAAGTSKGVKLTLLDNANSAMVTEGETKTISVGSSSYSVKILFIDDDEVILEVNGVKTNKMKEGDVFKVGTDTYVAVKNVLYNAKESGISQAEISIGSGKIVLENNQEVKLNNEDISESTDMILNAYITNSSTDIQKIVLEWLLDDDDFWIAPGTELVLPGFETIKISMTGFNMPKEEKTVMKADGTEKYVIETTVTDGDVKLYVLYNNDTNILGIGEKDKHLLVTSATPGTTDVVLNETENSYFVATVIDGDDAETYIYEIDSITEKSDGDNSTVLKSLSGGSDVKLSGINDDADRGDVNFLLKAADDKLKKATVTVSTTGGGTLYTDRIVTAEGMTVLLPVSGDGTGFTVNLTADALSTSWTTNVTEEDKDGKIANGGSFTVTASATDDGIEPARVTSPALIETEDESDQYEGYVISNLATKLLWSNPSSGANKLEITYAGEQSSADVYISEAAVSFTGGVSGAVKVVTDAEVDSVSDKNLLVVGGSCINTVAATLLGSSTPMCGADFTAATDVDAGKYLIEVVASPYNAEKVAMLIAGYEGEDTAAAVNAVKTGTVDTAVGTEVIGPSLG